MHSCMDTCLFGVHSQIHTQPHTTQNIGVCLILVTELGPPTLAIFPTLTKTWKCALNLQGLDFVYILMRMNIQSGGPYRVRDWSYSGRGKLFSLLSLCYLLPRSLAMSMAILLAMAPLIHSDPSGSHNFDSPLLGLQH